MIDVSFNARDSVQGRAQVRAQGADSFELVTLDMAAPLVAPELDWADRPALPSMCAADGDVS